MRTTHLAKRFTLAGVAASAAAVLLGLATAGGSQAQTPEPTATSTLIPTTVPVATSTPEVQTPVPSVTAIPTITPFASVTPVATVVITPTTTAPSGATAADACSMPLASANGGDTIEFESIQLTLPAGSYIYGFIRADTGNSPAVVVCSLDTVSTIYIDALTGLETGRNVGAANGGTVLDAVRAQVRSRNSPGVISPPSTGDAGLLP